MAYAKTERKHLRVFKWVSYSYIFYNEDTVQDFRKWIAIHEWNEVKDAEGSNRKAEAYQASVTEAMQACFPTRTTRRQSTDLPWINSRIRKRIKRRKAVFRDEGRSARWRKHKVATDNMIARRRDGYFVN